MKRVLALCSTLLVAVVPFASAATINHTAVSCVPASGNAKIVASADGVASARVYFRADSGTSEYYVEMLKGADGFWAALPIPAPGTSAVAYRIVTRDADGTETSTAVMNAAVSATCASFPLDPIQRQVASNLVVGQTAEPAAAIVGFRCDGIKNTITASGQMKAYDGCDGTPSTVPATAPGLFAARNLAIAGAALAVGAGVVVIEENSDDSPVSPILP